MPACKDGRSIWRIPPRTPSVCFGTCRLNGETGTNGVNGSRNDHEGDDGDSKGSCHLAHMDRLNIKLQIFYKLINPQ